MPSTFELVLDVPAWSWMRRTEDRSDHEGERRHLHNPGFFLKLRPKSGEAKKKKRGENEDASQKLL